jgi:hypothetical protein
VRSYDLMGSFLGTLASPVDNLRGIAISGGVLYCTGGNNDYVPIFDVASGAPLGDFIPSGRGGLDSPFDILFRSSGDVLVTSINSDEILRYDLAGAFLGVFATNILFGEQLFETRSGNILVADFSRNAVIELTAAGAEIASLGGVPGVRGAYELPNGNVLTTNGTGVHELDRVTGALVNTHLGGISARFIELVNLGPPIPAPTCTLAGPMMVASGDITLTLDADSMNSMSVDVVFEHSTDGGTSWSTSTAAMGSPLANPALGVPLGISTFVWDSAADAVGAMMLQPGVIVRATVDDGVAPMTGECETTPFDVDNSALCQGICGDCDLDMAGPNILDALVGAQIAAGILIASQAQQGCCDVDASGQVTILDALVIAQGAAGLMVTMTCP